MSHIPKRAVSLLRSLRFRKPTYPDHIRNRRNPCYMSHPNRWLDREKRELEHRLDCRETGPFPRPLSTAIAFAPCSYRPIDRAEADPRHTLVSLCEDIVRPYQLACRNPLG